MPERGLGRRGSSRANGLPSAEGSPALLQEMWYAPPFRSDNQLNLAEYSVFPHELVRYRGGIALLAADEYSFAIS